MVMMAARLGPGYQVELIKVSCADTMLFITSHLLKAASLTL